MIRSSLKPTDVMLHAALEHAVAQAPNEACGVFFYPDQRLVIGENGRRIPGLPAFVPVPNRSEDPARSFAFDYEAMTQAIGLAYWGTPSGRVQIWHSHPDASGPSIEDHQMVPLLEDLMAGHPTWGMTPTHRLLTLENVCWWEYDGQVAWHD